MNDIIQNKQNLKGSFPVAPDKSISHRAVMFGAIAKGTTVIDNFLTGADCIATIDCFRRLGVDIETNGNHVTVQGKGLHGLSKSNTTLDVGNSGTTIRLMTGLLAAQPFDTTITGDETIQRRPMGRVIQPLNEMGANIQSHDHTNLAPLTIHGRSLKGITYTLPVASAQIKSAILLASLYGEGETKIVEPISSRNHTELMLNYFGANIRKENGIIYSQPLQELHAQPVTVPGDISSAAYFLVAGSICKDSQLRLEGVGVNPTRTGLIDALKQMGAQITFTNERIQCGEPVADLEVCTASLKGITIGGGIIPRMIDEIPAFAVAALCANGTTVIKDAQELKVKESNRIHTVVTELKKFGANIEETDDGMIIHGGAPLYGTQVECYHDHRIAMSMAIAGLVSEGETCITNGDCIDVSFPNFFELLASL